jgi:Alpha-L-arabinofuranosidase B (ABFB) domain
MQRLSVRSLVVGTVLFVSLLAPRMTAGQQEVLSSFRSVNYPDHFIRHRQSLGYIDRIVATDKLGRKDATFRTVPGLAGKCRSIESVNYPGHFLRHQNYRVTLSKRSDDELFKKDATFCVVPGLASSQGRSFQSLNFPDHYIRHMNFELWLAKREPTDLFKKDATFFIGRPLTQFGPSAPID